jgi:hypothetical protein
MDIFWMFALGLGLLLFIHLAIPLSFEKKGSIAVISYGIFPFEHTTISMSTYSQDDQFINVEGKHMDFKTDNGVYYTIKYKHIPFHWYNTLESAE